MASVLYAVPGSHPCAAVEEALRLKGLPYERVDTLPLLSRALQRLRFGTARAPGIVFDDGTRVAGSRAIVRALEERAPEPPLLPAEVEREARARVERAEEWGDEVLQPLVRRVVWAALRRAPGASLSYSRSTPLPRPLARLGAPLLARAAARMNHAGDATVRADLIHLETHVSRVEGWIEEGVLGGERPNAADLQIGASLRLLISVEDVGARLGDRPAAALARRWFPEYPGRVPSGALPEAWLRGEGGVPRSAR